jgi:hypothetical protein
VRDREAFFIGWSNRLAPSLRDFLVLVTAILVGGLLALSALLASTITDPGRGLFDTGALPEPPRDVTLTGTLVSTPHPMLMLPADAAHPEPHGVLLSGDGKHGATLDRLALQGRQVEAKGTLFKRGALDMLVIYEPPRPIGDAVRSGGALEAVKLGRWRVVGEICDGKCAAGAMVPGTGLAHKACANLCLLGKVPPVFVSTKPLLGHEMLVLADTDGKEPGDRIRDLVATRIVVEGDVERHGDVLVLRADLAHARRY